MDKNTREMRKALGYEVNEDDSPPQELSPGTKMPAFVFGYSALTVFIIGIIGMGVELSNDEFKYFFMYFSLSFFIAPALLIYPVFRFVLGTGKSVFAVSLSAIFGYYVQSNIKKKIDKWS